jgi:hypothetical protein
MTLLRPQNSLHYICAYCHAEFRFAAIEGPSHAPAAILAVYCPFCGRGDPVFMQDGRK